MQLMSWTVARLGSRFQLMFEPYQRRMRHSALGHQLDQPMDLMVGLVEPDGTERVMPFSTRGTLFSHLEQFERINSITFRGHSEQCGLRFEFNVHSVFYPQDEALCTLPVIYLEVRVNPAGPIRGAVAKQVPDKVKLFLRINRPETEITASSDNGARIDLRYQSPLTPADQLPRHENFAPGDRTRTAQVAERIVSLNPGCQVEADGRGLTLDLPVTEVGSGTKWRLVWGAFCGDPVLDVASGGETQKAKFRYARHYHDLEDVMAAGVALRDGYLARSRRFDKFFDQSSLHPAQRHLINQSFQTLLGNTFWCDLEDGGEWFSAWDDRTCMHSSVDCAYNTSLLYLMLWPNLLEIQLNQWAQRSNAHPPSSGAVLDHDLGFGTQATGQAMTYDMPLESAADFLLMMQAHARWTGELATARRHAGLVEKLANYLAWTDTDQSGFASEGQISTTSDADPAASIARKQVYLAIKRMAGLAAASDLLLQVGRDSASERANQIVEEGAALIEAEAWLGDHFAVCVDRDTSGLIDLRTGKPLPLERVPGWDEYSIATANALLLPALAGQSLLFDSQRLKTDLISAARETRSHYGCGHTSAEPDHVWVSQNIWRDLMLRYLGSIGVGAGGAESYWELQVACNTFDQSCGFSDSYLSSDLSMGSRGMDAIGYMLAQPRLVIDRLAPGGQRISVEPDRHGPQRWPLLALADWKAGKIPVCVVTGDGRVLIENECDPVIIRGAEAESAQLIG